MKVHNIGQWKYSYALSIEEANGRWCEMFRECDKVTNVRLCIFLYVFSIKKAMWSSLVIYKSIAYVYIYISVYITAVYIFIRTYNKSSQIKSL